MMMALRAKRQTEGLEPSVGTRYLFTPADLRPWGLLFVFILSFRGNVYNIECMASTTLSLLVYTKINKKQTLKNLELVESHRACLGTM